MANHRLAALSDNDRQELDAWLVEFGEQWGDGALPERARRLPPTSSWRLPALCEMVKIDLERQWGLGNRLSLETYLQEYPELGNPSDVSADFIQAEYEVRNQFGAAADLDEYARRFPAQIDELRRLIAAGHSSLSFRSKSASNLKSATRRRAPADTAQELPEQFGRYRILNRLGAGGMGSVYLAEDTRLKRKVALKVTHISGPENRQVLERFHREAEAAAGLDHPYLCKVYDVDEIENVHYLTMEYIEGTTLAAFMAGQKDRSQRQVAAIVGKLALALQEAHAKGVVHRDLKPANVMIRKTGQKAPVIVDFGLAQQLDAGGTRLTQTGQAMGTPHYMAIEQIKGDLGAIGPASDIYALGVMLYELLTGNVPFDGPNPMVVVAQILTTRAAPPSSLRPDLDPKLEAICLKAMAREIKDRYASMAEFAAALSEYLKAPATATSDYSSVATPEVTGERASRPQGSDTLMGRFLETPPVKNTTTPNTDRRSKVRPVDPPDPVSEAEAEGPRRRWPMIAGIAAAFVVLLLCVVVYVVTDKGRIKITVNGPAIAVKVDGAEVRLEGLDEPITLRAGEHEMTVKWRNAETETRKFDVKRGPNEDYRFEYEPLALRNAAPKREAQKAALANGTVNTKASSDVSVPSDPIAQVRLETITNSIGMKLALIPAGEFLMGSSKEQEINGGSSEGPPHRVRITRPFYLGVTEVTQGQYKAVTGQTPSQNRGSDELPVDQVNWLEAVAFCNALSNREKLTPYYLAGQSLTIAGGNGYRLPTEAEWEYACRAGTTTTYSFGNDASRIGDFALLGIPDRGILPGGGTHPVGEKQANPFGLYDMYGNVSEWCWDGWEPDYYRKSWRDDPTGPALSPVRMYRGGSFTTRTAANASSASRSFAQADWRNDALGFRVARTQPKLEVATSRASPVLANATVARKATTDVSVPSGRVAQRSLKTVTNSIGMDLALIPAGEFLMGAPDADMAAQDNEKPQHRVRITRPFYLGVHEVTKGQFRRFVTYLGLDLDPEMDGRGAVGWNANKRDFEKTSHYGWQIVGFPQTDEHPVVNVNWNEATSFAAWLSKKEGKSYRLPTEAEWEYACRAGTTTRYPGGEDWESLASVGNVADAKAKSFYQEWASAIASDDKYIYTAPVGQFTANAFGLYDMRGNVWEWCLDGYSADFYKSSQLDDPVGPLAASERVVRGGSWRFDPRGAGATFRAGQAPDLRRSDVGFRVVLNPSGQSQVNTNAGGAMPQPQNKEAKAKPDAKTQSSPRYDFSAETLMGKAKNLEKARKTKSAVKAYEQIIQDFPGTEQALKAQARINVIQGK